jgi:quercetin dioxygenase-like cupin family protein
MNTFDTGSPVHAPAPLRRRLLERVQASHAHERQFHTVRRDGGWRSLPARREKALAATGIAHTALVELAALAALPHDAACSQVEIVVLDGQASLGGLTLRCGDAACAPHDAATALVAGSIGTRLFIRWSAPAQPARAATVFPVLGRDAGWVDFLPGVRIKPLWEDGERSSMLVHMRAGAMVRGHGHDLEEECMMLAGEAFVGDTLLRAGEYQLAPAGSVHGAITTDVGALFYVHGALDPAQYVD